MSRINWVAFIGVGVSSVLASQGLLWITGWNPWLCFVLGSLTGLCWPPVIRKRT